MKSLIYYQTSTAVLLSYFIEHFMIIVITYTCLLGFKLIRVIMKPKPNEI